MASTSTLFSQPPQISRLVTHLTEAIHTGNSSWAKELVAEVLNNGLKLNVNVSKDQDSQRSKEKEFNLTVNVEDRLASGTTFELFVKSSDSVADLKRKVSVLHKIPTDLQRWIIGKKIPDDNTTLRNAGVSGPGHTLFLYVVTQQPVGPGMRDGSGNGREQQSRNSNNLESSLLSKIMSNNLSYEGQPKEVEFMLMSANTQSQASHRVSVVEVGETQGTPPPIPKRVPLQSAYDDDCEQTKVVSNPLMRVIPTASSKFPTSKKELEPQPKIEDKSGWTCPVCTYFNMPTRPGCEMCATSRPEGYVVPDNYQMTDKEVAMIVHQNELEKMTRQPCLDDNIYQMPGSQASGPSSAQTRQHGAVPSLGMNRHELLYQQFLKQTSFSDANRGFSSGQDKGSDRSYSFLELENSSSSSSSDDDRDDNK